MEWLLPMKIQDFEVECIQVDRGGMEKCVRFNENPTKTSTDGFTVKHRKYRKRCGPRTAVQEILSDSSKSFSKGDP